MLRLFALLWTSLLIPLCSSPAISPTTDFTSISCFSTWISWFIPIGLIIQRFIPCLHSCSYRHCSASLDGDKCWDQLTEPLRPKDQEPSQQLYDIISAYLLLHWISVPPISVGEHHLAHLALQISGHVVSANLCITGVDNRKHAITLYLHSGSGVKLY